MSYVLKEKDPITGWDDYYTGNAWQVWSSCREDAFVFGTKEEAQAAADFYRGFHDEAYMEQNGEPSKVRVVRLVKKQA